MMNRQSHIDRQQSEMSYRVRIASYYVDKSWELATKYWEKAIDIAYVLEDYERSKRKQ